MVKKMGGRQGLAGTVFTLTTVALLVVPTYFLSDSMVDGAQGLVSALDEGTLKVPAPAESVKEWPIIGEKTYAAWQLASTNIDEAIVKFSSALKKAAKGLFSIILGGGLGVLQFVLSLIIAGILLVNTTSRVKAVEDFALKVSPRDGQSFMKLAVATIRSVAQGVVGIGIIQGIFVGIGFAAMGVPGAGLWALLVMILSIAQLPPFLVILPVLGYVYSSMETSTLGIILFTIWSVFGGILDGLLKPFVMGRGVDAPMLIVMLGAIGGMIFFGIIGLFIGAILLSLAYILYVSWVETDKDISEEIV
jgi:predicted PurR-regulated permease PerM